MSTTEISIVVPLFNEEGCVGPLYDAITKALSKINSSYEILFIDDGSSDATFEKAKILHEKDNRLKLIKFRKNSGQTAAMQAGFDHAKGDIIISMDGDLQNDPEDIPLLLSKINEGYDLVSGWRKDRKDRLISRKIPSKAANWLIGVVTGVKIHDNGCSLKAYRAKVLKKMDLYSEMHRFIPAIASSHGARIAEIVVRHHPRTIGVSKYGLSRIWKVFFDLISIKMVVSFASTPLRYFVIIAIPFLLSALVAFYITISQFFSGIFYITIFGTCVLCFFVGFYLIMLGLFSEVVLHTGDNPQRDVIYSEHR